MQASLSEMIAPGALVLLTPLVVGTLFGTRTLAGVLAGALVSGVQMAVSMSNTGGAWDNAKKYVEVTSCSPPPLHYIYLYQYRYTTITYMCQESFLEPALLYIGLQARTRAWCMGWSEFMQLCERCQLSMS